MLRIVALHESDLSRRNRAGEKRTVVNSSLGTFVEVEDDGGKKGVIYPHYWTCDSRESRRHLGISQWSRAKSSSSKELQYYRLNFKLLIRTIAFIYSENLISVK